MIIKRGIALDSISQNLTYLVTYISTSNGAGLFDINRLSEDFFISILNTMYDLNLVNLNTEKPNYPAIDLGDRNRRVSVQVTSESNTTKLKTTLSKFRENSLIDDYDELIFLVLSNNSIGRPTDKEITLNVVDPQAMMNKISQLVDEKVYTIENYFNENLTYPNTSINTSILPQIKAIDINSITTINMVNFLGIKDFEEESYLRKDLENLLMKLSVIQHHQRELLLYIILNGRIKYPNGVEYNDTLYMFDYILADSISNSEMIVEILCQEELMYRSDKYNFLDFEGEYQYLHLYFGGIYETNIFRVMKDMYGTDSARLYRVLVDCDFSEL